MSAPRNHLTHKAGPRALFEFALGSGSSAASISFMTKTWRENYSRGSPFSFSGPRQLSLPRGKFLISGASFWMNSSKIKLRVKLPTLSLHSPTIYKLIRLGNKGATLSRTATRAAKKEWFTLCLFAWRWKWALNHSNWMLKQQKPEDFNFAQTFFITARGGDRCTVKVRLLTICRRFNALIAAARRL